MKSYFGSLPFWPLAFALFLALLAAPFARGVDEHLLRLSNRHGDLVAELRATFGVDLSAAVPRIEFPDPPGQGSGQVSETGGNRPALFPAELTIEIDATRQSALREGFRVGWMLADIRLTARFAAPPPDVGAQSGSGSRVDWSGAVLRLPYPAPQSLADHPEIALEGQIRRMHQQYGPHNRLVLEWPVSAPPEGDVVISYRRTAIGPDIVIGTDAARTRVNLTTDFPLTHWDGPRPQVARSSGSDYEWRWTIDKPATVEGTADAAATETPGEDQGFLGMSVREPDEAGTIVMYSDLTRPVFSGISGLVQFTPIAYALAALVTFICRVPGVWPQAGLAIVVAVALAVSLYSVRHLGDGSGWYLGAVVAALGAGAVLWPRGPWAAVIVAFTLSAAWAALPLVPANPYEPGPLPSAVVVLRLCYPAVLALAVLATLISAIPVAGRLVSTAARHSDAGR